MPPPSLEPLLRAARAVQLVGQGGQVLAPVGAGDEVAEKCTLAGCSPNIHTCSHALHAEQPAQPARRLGGACSPLAKSARVQPAKQGCNAPDPPAAQLHSHGAQEGDQLVRINLALCRQCQTCNSGCNLQSFLGAAQGMCAAWCHCLGTLPALPRPAQPHLREAGQRAAHCLLEFRQLFKRRGPTRRCGVVMLAAGSEESATSTPPSYCCVFGRGVNLLCSASPHSANMLRTRCASCQPPCCKPTAAAAAAADRHPHPPAPGRPLTPPRNAA